MMNRFTVFGGAGFIGSHLVRYLNAKGEQVIAPGRDEAMPPGHQGHVVYCAGLSAELLARPNGAIQAQAKLTELLRAGRFLSLLYISSTRIDAAQSHEQAYVAVKRAGEALCLASPNPQVRIARLSDVFGNGCGGFFGAVLREATTKRFVELDSSLASARDYVAIEDVVRGLHHIALNGGERRYNVAAGSTVTNREIATALRKHTGATVIAKPDAPTVIVPEIDISHIQAAFDGKRGWAPASLIARLPALLAGDPAGAGAAKPRRS
jgi:nucleoside-diphosphate-sugar epimerase